MRHVRRGPRPHLPVDRPPALPLLHPVRPERRRGDVRPGRRGLVDLRGLVARGLRRGLRREPGAALDRRPGRDAGRRRWRLHPGRHDRQPLRAGRRAAHRPAHGGGRRCGPNRVAATAGAHSSISSACDVMDAELVGVPVDDRWRLTGPSLRAVLEENGPETFFAVVATCGTTNFGIIDDLASVAEVCREFGHLVPRRRGLRRRRRWPPPRCATSTPASSTATRSSSTRTSGSSPRSTAAPCSTASRPRPAPRTPSGPATSTCSPRPTSGTPPTTRSA